jgi:FMN phosphatase YigB (HAD superfamily)
MISLHGETYFSDVDDTLVLHGYDPSDEVNAIDVAFRAADYDGGVAKYGDRVMNFRVVPHVEHIARLREMKRAGYKVVVWSRGGSQWAECVVRRLGLQPVPEGGDGTVDAVMAKPDYYLDDVLANNFMKRLYLDHVSPNGAVIGLGQYGVEIRRPKS